MWKPASGHKQVTEFTVCKTVSVKTVLVWQQNKFKLFICSTATAIFPAAEGSKVQETLVICLKYPLMTLIHIMWILVENKRKSDCKKNSLLSINKLSSEQKHVYQAQQDWLNIDLPEGGKEEKILEEWKYCNFGYNTTSSCSGLLPWKKKNSVKAHTNSLYRSCWLEPIIKSILLFVS